MGPPKCWAPGNCPVCPPLEPSLILHLWLLLNSENVLNIRPVRSIQFLILHIKYNTYLYFSIICVNNFYKKIVTFGHEAFKV